MFKLLRKQRLKRIIRKEQSLRERCIQYANGNELRASEIYRFIVKGTRIDLVTKKEYNYLNLEGVIHQD